MLKDSPQPWGLCVWGPAGEEPSPSVHLGHCPFLPVWVGWEAFVVVSSQACFPLQKEAQARISVWCHSQPCVPMQVPAALSLSFPLCKGLPPL